MENNSSMPSANVVLESSPKLFSEDEMRWLQANEILLQSSCIPFADTIEDREFISGVNASNVIPTDVSTTSTSGQVEDSFTHPTSEHHHPQTTSVSETLTTEEELPIAETNSSYLEQVTNAMGAAVGLLPPSADPHLSSSYKAISANSLPNSLSHRPSRPKLNPLRVQSATLHQSHIPTPRRRLQSASPKTWHKNRHYHLDGDQDEIDTTKGASEDIESELPDVFSISSPSWLAEPSLNDPEASFDASASTPDMASLISSSSMPSTTSLNTSAPSTQPPTPTKSISERPQLTKTPTSLSLGERKEWIYRQPKQRTPLPTPPLNVSITNTPQSPSPRSPSRTSPPIRPKTSPTSPSRLPVRQRKASGLPKPPQHHFVGSHTGSSRVLSASSIERKTRVIHVSAETAPSPANLSTSSAGQEASSTAKLNGGVTPVARPIHSVIPARPGLKRKPGEEGSGDGNFGKDIGKERERQEGSGVMGFWSNLKLRPRGGSLSSLSSSLTSKKAPSPPAIVVEEAMEESTSTVHEERVETDTRKRPSFRSSLQAPASRRTTSTSSILSQKTLKDVEENQGVTTPTTQIPKPITIITTPVELPSSRATAPDSPRIRSSSESSGSSCRSHSTTNTQLSAASSATAPSTAPTTPICSQPSFIPPSPKPLGPSSVPMPPRPILSRSPSTSSSKAPTSSLSSKRRSTSALGGKTPSPAKSVSFVDTPTVHYAPEDDGEDEDKEVTSQTDDVFLDKPQPKRSNRWPPLIEGRQGLKLPRGRWQEIFADHSSKDLGNTSILEEDEDEESSMAPTESTTSLDAKATLKKLMNFSRNSLDVSPRPSLSRNPSSASSASTKARPKGGRPSISGPFALGSLPLPNANSPSASTPAAFISAPSSMLRYQQSSQSSPNRSTTSLRSTTSIRSHTQSLRGSSTSLGSGSTNPRRPHYKSNSYSHPPRANGILPFINADSPASSTISSVSASPSPSPFPAKGSRVQKSPYTVSLHGSPSVESFKSTAGRSVRSLGSFKSTMSAGGFRAWLNKVGEGIGISQHQPPVVDEEA